MNEGCDGGWGIFNGFFAENGHLVSEDCAPYHARTKGESCSNYKHCPAVAKINKSYYVGGYQWQPTVQMIQKEMLMHGPVVTEFRCDDNFQLYSSGIMIQAGQPVHQVFNPTVPKLIEEDPAEEILVVPNKGSISFAQISPSEQSSQSLVEAQS